MKTEIQLPKEFIIHDLLKEDKQKFILELLDRIKDDKLRNNLIEHIIMNIFEKNYIECIDKE